MEPFACPGAYIDERGAQDITWEFTPSPGAQSPGGYGIRTTVRGVRLLGPDLDALEPQSRPPDEAGLSLDRHGYLAGCVLTGDLPCTIHADDQIASAAVTFRLDLRQPGPGQNHLRLSCVLDGTRFTVSDGWFEDGLLRLQRQLPGGARITACITCLLSDYSPAGHGLLGMRCHRDAQSQYLAVRSKSDYWSVPVTEYVPETYLCPQYRRRIPGTGYRG